MLVNRYRAQESTGHGSPLPPQAVAAVTREWSKGADERLDRVHPFRKYFEELEVGETLLTHRRTVTESDEVNFAGISVDFFYAHMDDVAVAHGYFVLSAAAGLFVDPAPARCSPTMDWRDCAS